MSPDDKPTSLVIFGGSGDLAQRKLVPSLFSLYRKGRLPARIEIVGFATTPYSHQDFRDHLREGVQQFTPQHYDAQAWDEFAARLWYVAGNFNDTADYERLAAFLSEREAGAANRLYYCATLSDFFAPIADALGKLHMAKSKDAWRRIVLEKPFGHDLASAEALNRALHRVFEETQIFRMDHYLGKETSQNVMFFRFANTIFEPIWNRNYIDNVQITAIEDVDVGHRGGYYDQAGVLRDMFQNHLLQLLCLAAMEPPAAYDAEAIRNEKIKVLSAVAPIELASTVRGQYRGYCDTPKVASDSQTATYAALTLYVDNWRWQGVPFYLRSGKSLVRKSTGIIIQFRCPPHLMFEHGPFVSNLLSLCIQPDEGAHIICEAKVPDSEQDTRPVSLGFHYKSYFGAEGLPDAYERLLLDVMRGDASLFPRRDAIEAAWRIVDPIVQGWESSPEAPPLVTYEPGVWGPDEADELLARDGRCWIVGCPGSACEDEEH